MGKGGSVDTTDQLQLQAAIGYQGSVVGGLISYGDYLLYPLGSTIIVKNKATKKQKFLHGHDDPVNCMAVSSNGKWIASGTLTHQGYKAEIIIWDFESLKIVHKLPMHQVEVKSMTFSPSGKYLVSLGGQDDNQIVLWDTESGKAIMGSRGSAASSGKASVVRFLNASENVFVSGGDYNLRVWSFDPAAKKLSADDCQLGNLKRCVISMVVDESDTHVYCGTSTGDVLLLNIKNRLFRLSGPKEPLGRGVQTLAVGPSGKVIAGAGDGTLALLDPSSLSLLASVEAQGSITSISTSASAPDFWVGTDQSNMYQGSSAEFSLELVHTSHSQAVNDICFPSASSSMFVTCSVGDIRVWDAAKRSELLRIQVPNLEAFCCTVSPDGKALISGWSDGKIRAFGPQSGKLLYVINDAHTDGVTAIAVTKDNGSIISGGKDGQVRVWRVHGNVQTLESALKDHRGAINCIRVRSNDSEFVSASSDGSTIIWNAEKLVRDQVFLHSTCFTSAAYYPDETQMVTVGTDKTIMYWDPFDGSAIRELEGSSDTIRAVAISADGQNLVTGGDDKLLKVWSYDQGTLSKVGMGHSGAIKALTIAPDQKSIVTVGGEGGIFIWSHPQA